MSITLPVTSMQGAYEIVIASGSLSRLGHHLAGLRGCGHVLVVADDAIADTHAAVVAASLRDAGWAVSETTLQAQESLKTMSTVQSIWDDALAAGLNRDSAIIAVGGGLTGDVAGFAAATYMRGIDLIQVPTTLLAMVDASIGGKTGVNMPLPSGDQLGKNLAGAFWAPTLVWVDPNTLQTLPLRELHSGLAECVKHGVIADRELLKVMMVHAEALQGGNLEAILDLLDRSIKVKRGIVQADERESGERMLLNLGHTFGHAIEPIEELDLTHGEAVSIGMCAAAWCAVHLGINSQRGAEELVQLLTSLGLPTRLPKSIDIDGLWDAMRFDKKNVESGVRLVLPTCESAVVRDDVSEQVVREAWSHVMPSPA